VGIDDDKRVVRILFPSPRVLHSIVKVGTRYREVVQMMPFVKRDILSEVTRFEPFSVLEEKWRGGGMEGILTYFLIPFLKVRN